MFPNIFKRKLLFNNKKIFYDFTVFINLKLIIFVNKEFGLKFGLVRVK